MRFCVELNLLADESGKVVSASDPKRLSYEWVDAPSVDEAIQEIARRDGGGELLFGVHKMTPMQAMATLKRERIVKTLHAFPEEEARERLGGELPP